MNHHMSKMYKIDSLIQCVMQSNVHNKLLSCLECGQMCTYGYTTHYYIVPNPAPVLGHHPYVNVRYHYPELILM